jgi:hypothetical protein
MLSQLDFYCTNNQTNMKLYYLGWSYCVPWE